MLRIVVEPTELLNVGDAVMLEVALARLRAMWPDGVITYFGDAADPAVARLGVVPVPIHGRHIWFDEPFLDLGPLAHLPGRFMGRRTALERRIRRLWPRVARALLRFRLRRRGRERDARAVDTFFETVRQADVAFVCGMGGIADAFPDYAYELLGTLHLALTYGARAVLVGQGIGPLDDSGLRAEARAVLPRVDFIGLREQRSGHQLLLSLGVNPGRIMVTGDDAIEVAFDRRSETPGDGLGVNLRLAPYAEIDRSVLDRTREVLNRFEGRTGATLIPVPISHAPADADAETLRILLAEHDPESNGGSDLNTALKVIDQVKRCRLVLTASYHAAVFSLSMGIPAVGLARSSYYDHKFRGLADQFGAGCDVVSLGNSDWPDQLLEVLQRAWDSAVEMRPHLLASAARQVALSHQAYRRIRALVEAPW